MYAVFHKLADHFYSPEWSASAVTFTSYVNTIYSQQWSHTEYSWIKLKANFGMADFKTAHALYNRANYGIFYEMATNPLFRSALKMNGSLRINFPLRAPKEGSA